MPDNPFDAFNPVDDLAQLIYQGAARFVLLSSVDFDGIGRKPGWDIHVGLSDKGRWWKGRWEAADVHAISVSAACAGVSCSTEVDGDKIGRGCLAAAPRGLRGEARRDNYQRRTTCWWMGQCS